MIFIFETTFVVIRMLFPCFSSGFQAILPWFYRINSRPTTLKLAFYRKEKGHCKNNSRTNTNIHSNKINHTSSTKPETFLYSAPTPPDITVELQAQTMNILENFNLNWNFSRLNFVWTLSFQNRRWWLKENYNFVMDNKNQYYQKILFV